jgi:hypothetical protein
MSAWRHHEESKGASRRGFITFGPAMSPSAARPHGDLSCAWAQSGYIFARRNCLASSCRPFVKRVSFAFTIIGVRRPSCFLEN